MKHLTEHPSWQALFNHTQEIGNLSLAQLKNTHLTREQELIISNHSLSIDLTNQRVNQNTLRHLFSLAEECQLKQKIHDLVQGGLVNPNENRPALHTALRQLDNTPIYVNGENVVELINHTRERMRDYAEKIRNGSWLGYSNKPIQSIVNIGIGGSDLGPELCIHALTEEKNLPLSYHFISDVDPMAFDTVVADLNPETTLFIISSKSFNTRETIYNANKAIAWIGKHHNLDRHFIAVSAHVNKTKSLGFNNVLPIWDWVGGRYSLCSAINLITMIAIGYEKFMQLLAGAFCMDQHFIHTEFNKNLPVLLALTGIWNTNFLNINNLLLLTYCRKLDYFTHYIQQLDMESNGKSMTIHGQKVNYNTGPIVWGGLGNHAQHSYFQLLCQGTHKVAIDSLIIKDNEGELINQSCNMKMTVLTGGIDSPSNPIEAIPGNMPFNKITLSHCSAFALGELIALYEHKVYTQSVIWNINPFNQPGVESAKRYCFAE